MSNLNNVAAYIASRRQFKKKVRINLNLFYHRLQLTTPYRLYLKASTPEPSWCILILQTYPQGGEGPTLTQNHSRWSRVVILFSSVQAQCIPSR